MGRSGALQAHGHDDAEIVGIALVHQGELVPVRQEALDQS